jgi:acetyl-CoA acyltransferase 2
VPAIQALLKKSKLSVSDIDVAEVNEAFAPQFLAVQKALGLNPEKTNVNGGAIALGHPLAASGSRITANLVYELRYLHFFKLRSFFLFLIILKISAF